MMNAGDFIIIKSTSGLTTIYFLVNVDCFIKTKTNKSVPFSRTILLMKNTQNKFKCVSLPVLYELYIGLPFPF